MSVYIPQKTSFQSSLPGPWQTSISTGTLAYSGGDGCWTSFVVIYWKVQVQARILCDILELIIENYRALSARPHGQNLPSPHQTIHRQSIANFWRGLQSRTQSSFSLIQLIMLIHIATFPTQCLHSVLLVGGLDWTLGTFLCFDSVPFYF